MKPELPGLDLHELVARTNLNEVWRGVRKEGGDCAVKLALTDPGSDAFRQEARIVESLRDARVSGVCPAEFRESPVPHLVLPWKGGRTFRDALDSKTARGRLVSTFLEVVETVARAHREGFLHGDLKPENILIDERDRPWLTDFGMARAIRTARLDSHVSVSMSASEQGWGGTLHYLPPEGLQGEAPAPEWDVYALGVILHEILLGRRPDRAATPEQLKSVLPAEVVDVLLDALAYAPSDRIRNARALKKRLDEIGDELTATGLDRGVRRVWRFGVVGLAAFFVALRYGMVAALLASYTALLVSCLFMPALLFVAIPILMLHAVIRWEGPETPEEAANRVSGRVL
jgi:serine/threonine protein kinase